MSNLIPAKDRFRVLVGDFADKYAADNSLSAEKKAECVRAACRMFGVKVPEEYQ